jgi:predicted negative regulator of RcsB-dependent stress response
VNRIAPPGFFPLMSRFLVGVAFFITFSVLAHAQAPVEPSKPPTESIQSSAEPEKSQPQAASAPADPTKSAEAMRLRIERARALIAAHRLDTAVSELESVRATAQDKAFRNIASIMLMNVYLEEGNYGRAEALLEENFQARGAQKDESLGAYFALAGQAVNGTRTHLARYRTFGVSTADGNLPAEAVSDLNRLRSFLERMIAQAKEISNARAAYDSLSLLEDVLGLRLSLAKDDEDQSKWQSEYASAREALASSQTQVASLGGIPPLRPGRTTAAGPAVPSPYSTKRPSDAQPTAEQTGELENNDAGSLNAFATRRVVPKYPPMAKQNGSTGLVRVYVVVEGGKVIAISRSEGPMLLRQAAEDAARQWLFQTVSIEGRPTRLSGYIEFNFSL